MIANGVKLLEESGVNYAEAMERFAGNESFYERLSLKFLNDPHYEALKKALEENNAEQAFREAHTLKGVAGNLSFSVLYEITCRVSDALRENDIVTARELMTPLGEAYVCGTAALAQVKD